jgi:DNA polymerase sigma
MRADLKARDSYGDMVCMVEEQEQLVQHVSELRRRIETVSKIRSHAKKKVEDARSNFGATCLFLLALFCYR